MSVTWILCQLIMLVIPAYFAFVGWVRLNKAPAMNAKAGYNSESSTLSEQAWAFAQKICGKRYLIASIVLAVFSLVLANIMDAPNDISMILLAVIFAALQITIFIVLMATIEVSIRKKFVPKTEK